jgi:hypothetical protein
MEWQAVVLAMQILLLATGWVLFQKARAELSAKAAEEPVLSEVRALQRNVKELLAEIEETGDAVSARIESRCMEARELLLALERRLEAVPEPQPPPRPAPAKRSGRRAATAVATLPAPEPEPPVAVVAAELPSAAPELSAGALRRETIYALADTGASSSDIARQTGLSVGEVETLLGLRLQKR